MVNYVFTPWRDRHELLLVRRQLYASTGPEQAASRQRGDEEDEARKEQQHQAVARVSMWMQRGNCPHMVESTALLLAAMLNDQDAAAKANAASSAYAIRAAYSAAFSRFVTGLLDGHQDKLRKQSMYAVAKTIGLPATFVELRHQSTHEQLPSLAKLRAAAKKGLAWIWGYYWKNLGDDDGGSGDGDDGGCAEEEACRAAVLRYLRQGTGDDERMAVKDLGQWSRESVLEAIAKVRARLPGNMVFLKCEELCRLLKEQEKEEDEETVDADMGDADAAAAETADGVADDFGWARFEGTWKPKPIGIA